MAEKTREEQLLDFFKALSDPTRLKIVGLLAHRDYTGTELAAILDLSPSTISNHMNFLQYVGVVTSSQKSYYSEFRLDFEGLREQMIHLTEEENLRQIAEGVDLDAFDRKVVENFSDQEGRLTGIPSQLKKFRALLNYVLKEFEPGTVYTEKEANDLIGRCLNPDSVRGGQIDVARLRRGLIEAKLLTRSSDGREYRRAEE